MSEAPVVDIADPDAVSRVVDALEAGGLVVLPTDTVYGLAASPLVEAATSEIFAAKGRRDDVPLAVLCHDAEQALGLVDTVPDRARTLAGRHWPGPLTLVLPRRADLGWELGSPDTTIGVRCPDHELVRAVTARTGPIAVTSANRHGAPTPAEARAAAGQLFVAPALVVDAGPLVATASTVVDATSDDLRVLRAGPISI